MKRKNSAPSTEDAFIREVTEELKNDQLKQFWSKYGTIVVIAVVLILSATVSFETIKVWKYKSDQKWSDKFTYAGALINRGDYDKSMEVLNNIIENGNSFYSDLAKVQVTNVMFAQGKNAEALAKLEEVVKDKGVIKKIRDIATIKLASYKTDTVSMVELRELLTPLIEENGSWANLAREMIALKAVGNGNFSEAVEIYEELLATPDLDEGMRSRVKDILSVISSENN